MTGWNLPPGCTTADIDRAMGGDDEECLHEERECDLITGRASCPECGETWHMTDDQIEAEYHLLAIGEWLERREARREWLRRKFSPLLSFFRRVLGRVSSGASKHDEIPF